MTLPLITFANKVGKEEVSLMPSFEHSIKSQITEYNLCTIFKLSTVSITPMGGGDDQGSALLPTEGQFPSITTAESGRTYLVSGDPRKIDPAKAKEQNEKMTAAKNRKLKEISDEQKVALAAVKSAGGSGIRPPVSNVVVPSSAPPPPAPPVPAVPAPVLLPKTVECPPPEVTPPELPPPALEFTKCPNCGIDVLQTSYDLHTVQCFRMKSKCADCGLCLDKSAMAQHYEETHKITKCKCGKPLTMKEVEHHRKTECPQREVVCQYCEFPMLFLQQADHEGTCGSKTEPCLRCNQRVTRKDMASHRCHVEPKVAQPKEPIPESTRRMETLREFKIGAPNADIPKTDPVGLPAVVPPRTGNNVVSGTNPPGKVTRTGSITNTVTKDKDPIKTDIGAPRTNTGGLPANKDPVQARTGTGPARTNTGGLTATKDKDPIVPSRIGATRTNAGVLPTGRDPIVRTGIGAAHTNTGGLPATKDKDPIVPTRIGATRTNTGGLPTTTGRDPIVARTHAMDPPVIPKSDLRTAGDEVLARRIYEEERRKTEQLRSDEEIARMLMESDAVERERQDRALAQLLAEQSQGDVRGRHSTQADEALARQLQLELNRGN
eukprot:PhF_6_TR22535/c0_g1_i3/m.32015